MMFLFPRWDMLYMFAGGYLNWFVEWNLLLCKWYSDLSQLKTAKSYSCEALSKVTAANTFIVVFLSRYRCLNQSLNVTGLPITIIMVWPLLFSSCGSIWAGKQSCNHAPAEALWTACRGGWNALGMFSSSKTWLRTCDTEKTFLPVASDYMRYFWVRSPKWGLGVVNLSMNFFWREHSETVTFRWWVKEGVCTQPWSTPAYLPEQVSSDGYTTGILP